jgi:hypothetical protein
MPRQIFRILGCVMAQTASHWPPTAKARARYQFRLVQLVFLVDKMALRHVFLQALLFSLVSVIPEKAPYAWTIRLPSMQFRCLTPLCQKTCLISEVYSLTYLDREMSLKLIIPGFCTTESSKKQVCASVSRIPSVARKRMSVVSWYSHY